jgi:predicted MPP superfamily phosphohydrolase
VSRFTFPIFFLVAVALLGGMHVYLWMRLVRDPALAEPWRRGMVVFLALAAVSVPAALVSARFASGAAARTAIALALGWLGTAFLLFSALLLADGVRLVAAAVEWIAAWTRPDPPADPGRRLFVARAVAGGAALAAGGATAWAVRRAVGEPAVREVPVRLDRLPPALSGFSIAQITDLHVGQTIRESDVRRVVELVNAARPDLVAITGDLVDAPVPALRHATEHLARLRARHGVVFVSGNHEYYSGAAAWLAEMRRCGIRVLHGERVRVGDEGPGGASLDVAGVPDWSVQGRDGSELARALQGRDPDRSLVLLAHQPRGVGEAVRAGVELQISGHTHGGQIFPWTLVVGAVFPYYRGLYRHREGQREGQVYVSTGAGYWGPPLRLGAPPEIAKVVLTT